MNFKLWLIESGLWSSSGKSTPARPGTHDIAHKASDGPFGPNQKPSTGGAPKPHTSPWLKGGSGGGAGPYMKANLAGMSKK